MEHHTHSFSCSSSGSEHSGSLFSELSNGSRFEEVKQARKERDGQLLLKMYILRDIQSYGDGKDGEQKG